MALVYPILYLMNHCDYKYRGKLLTFGEQEILLTDDQIKFFFNASFLKNNTPYKSKSILKNIGFDDVHSLEYPGYGNPNIEMDLNYPLDKKYYGSYDCILDAGHMEHCFNLSEIMKTMFNLVKNDGIIIHYNPCQGNMNHGFYNFQPTFYFSFYKYCGFKDIKVFLIEEQYSDNKSRYRVTPIFENYNNMQYYSLEKSSTYIMSFAVKDKNSKYNFPNQEFYQNIFNEKAKSNSELLPNQVYNKIVGNVPENSHENITSNSFYI